ncbi:MULTISPECIES: GNAT family N-acetyltransferase [Streptomyces]|uniref:GNAT family N-acetyltransferase n=1 Tax=Streptomyces evansiae TaxID=3075535 RepID=A0ABD5EAP0_9ACTN|nr:MULTISPECIES: GNAT family N-acetyltransferase [unclassified Streptomyces]EGJ76523.1 putative GCN5-related N-acetyltransferase [Streptomyces sp. Tu6071]MDT0413600.1 GNAT family N-acetyltransferase [Streptomyces sp. DSM 41979]MDT0418295.1 GNAT family N-acetyltransferase [Streptomyces sp. DSM 41982]MYQ60046.1 GNAT family N-acetyltransferase [Streptomyces sp. SID4926]WEH28192.1 GNAT family N-acetyltransferase [Streptomyces sp. AM 3-1-1]
MDIAVDDLAGPAIAAFLEAHVSQLRALSPPESTHALDLDGLRVPEVTFWTARESGEIVGCCAVKRIAPGHGELKSMRTDPTRTRSGVASALLRHALDESRRAGLDRVSLETGADDFFLPARTLYAKFGFRPCPPFGTYREDPLSVFLTRTL